MKTFGISAKSQRKRKDFKNAHGAGGRLVKS